MTTLLMTASLICCWRSSRKRLVGLALGMIGLVAIGLGGLPGWNGEVFGQEKAGSEIRHSLLVLGPSFTGILDEEGNVAWDANRPGARDGFRLENGNLLIVWADEVLEIVPESRLIPFRYRLSPENQELGTAQRLANGNTLISELGKQPRLLEVNPQGEVVHNCPLQPETDNAHMQTRMARQLPSGNYLVPHLLAFRVKEYTPEGKVVASLATDLDSLGGRAAENWPFTAIRLENGNTLVTLTHGNKVVEFDANGKPIWVVSNDDFTGKAFQDQKLFQDPCGAQRLPNGNTVICSYAAEKSIKVFEVTPDKKLVWSYAGPHRAHEVQVLTTNGEPVMGPLMK